MMIINKINLDINIIDYIKNKNRKVMKAGQ